jgi:8-hydroxy-5-deazaflavin:NADPH oxidoreductase
MIVGVLGTGTLAAALATAWSRAGHTLLVTGRSSERAAALATAVGPGVEALAPREVAIRADAVVLAVAWDGLDEALRLIGAPEGSLAGKVVIDCTNAVDFTTGLPLLAEGSAVERVASLATGARVVKALHLYAGASWLAPAPAVPPRTVAMCGDDGDALRLVSDLVRDLGGVPAVVGGMEYARQLEGVAGYVISLVRQGINPVTAVPSVR